MKCNIAITTLVFVTGVINSIGIWVVDLQNQVEPEVIVALIQVL